MINGLKSGWRKRIEIIEKIDLNNIQEFHKIFNIKDIYKVYAFQIGQALGLHEGVELYTKKSISQRYPKLDKYLYRQDTTIEDLLTYLDIFINLIKTYNVIENNTIVNFLDFNKTIDLKNEKYVKEKIKQ
jgi:hypothetical protein